MTQRRRHVVASPYRTFPSERDSSNLDFPWVSRGTALRFLVFVVLWRGMYLRLEEKWNDTQTYQQSSSVLEHQGTKNHDIEDYNFPSLSSPPTTDQVVEFLLGLARMPTDELRDELNVEDLFQLSSLMHNQTCPFDITSSSSGKSFYWPDWLPKQPDSTASRLFRSNVNQQNNRDKNAKSPMAVIWYEHLSKAGGTSFCELATKNMLKQHVPIYHCMPSYGKLRDGRVGLWSNQKLVAYLVQTSHLIVSNEWNPFDASKFDLRTENGKNPPIQLVFVTTIRNPLDRLLSAYRFWAVKPNRTAPTFSQWLDQRHVSSKKTQVPDWGIGSHVGNYNFAVWKFSNGTMPLSTNKFRRHKKKPWLRPPAISLLQHDNETEWRQPFETCIRTLARFDLVLPMEDMSHHPQPITETLGWTKDVGTTHVVSQGKVFNNTAKDFLSKDHYDILWDANRFDMILYYWIKAVYLTRIRCADAIHKNQKS